MKKLVFLVTCIIVVAYSLSTIGCAVIVPPTGGPRDSLPPVQTAALPKDSTINFKGNKIMLTFDEYVTLDNVFTNLIVSPVPKSIPEVTSHLHTVTIEIKDTLQHNTTYSYNFGKALKDINEGNVLKNYTYVFSTGDHLDTDSISGNVVLAETGNVDSTLLVVLYSNLSDTAVLKTTPKYYTRLDSNGHFAFRFLPKDSFNIFVVPDTYSKNYNDSTALFAFLDSTISTSNMAQVQNLKLYAFNAFPKVEEQKTKPILSEKQLEKEKEKLAKQPLVVSTSISDQKLSLLLPLTITYSKPLKTFDSSKILLTDTNFHRISNITIASVKGDTTNSHFELNKKWEQGKYYKLIVLQDAAIDSFGVKMMKSDTLNFQTKTAQDYAELKLNFPDVDMSQKPVLQIFGDEKLLDSVVINQDRQVHIPMFEPGNYKFRILYDTNGDRSWTPGNYQKKTQPEKVISLHKPFNFIAGIVNQWDIHLKANKKTTNDNPLINF